MQVNLEDLEVTFSQLLDRVAAGEEIVIARAGKPIARLSPIPEQAPRQPGLAKERVTDAFFEPLPREEWETWER
jgi:prevent-host-death family protein